MGRVGQKFDDFSYIMWNKLTVDQNRFSGMVAIVNELQVWIWGVALIFQLFKNSVRINMFIKHLFFANLKLVLYLNLLQSVKRINYTPVSNEFIISLESQDWHKWKQQWP